MLLTVSANVFALTCCSQCCTKGIVRVVLDGLEHLHLGCARGFIRIENDIISIRHIVRVDSHTFEVVTVIHHDTNLCVMAVTKAQVIYTAPNLDNTVFVQTAFVTIANRNAVGTHAGRTLELLECLTAIIRMVVTQSFGCFSLPKIMRVVNVLVVSLTVSPAISARISRATKSA